MLSVILILAHTAFVNHTTSLSEIVRDVVISAR